MNPFRRSFFNPGALATALLFCLMLPPRALTDLDVLYRLAKGMGVTGTPLRLVNLGENALVLALAFALAYLAALALWRTLERVPERYAPELASPPRKARFSRVLAYALPCLLVWSIYLYAYWPGVMTPDSFDQWEQAHNLALLNDWHSVGHTLLIFLLTRLWDSPAVVSAAQVLAMALAWGWAMAFFERAGMRRRVLLPLTLVFALLPYNGIMLVSLWKDIPYSVATLLLVFFLGRVVVSQGSWLASRGHAALLGADLAAVALLRHNGLLVLLVSLAALGIFYARQCWRGVLLAGVTAAAGVLLIQNGIAFGLLKAVPNDPAVSYEVVMQHIGAVIHYGAPYSPQEQAVLERIMPMTVWGKAYLRYSADSLSKPWGYQKDPQILAKIDANRGDLLRVFLALAARNPHIVLASEMDLTSMVWRILPPWNAEYRDYRFLFDLNSMAHVGQSVPPEMQQAHQGTAVKNWLDQLLTDSTNSLAADVFLWEGGVYLFLSLAFGLYGAARHGPAFWLLLVPPLANALSLALATPGNNFRYVYPIVAPTALIALFALSKKNAVVMLPATPEASPQPLSE